ncbi:uncharacterized protein LOC135083027 [Ostrinia nubilalis]|uniref:uncharacterized protein LOC135083027 n=1 Tax=Ostrinia nubilalis TaxID=29057 RepID=UPI0030822C4A
MENKLPQGGTGNAGESSAATAVTAHVSGGAAQCLVSSPATKPKQCTAVRTDFDSRLRNMFAAKTVKDIVTKKAVETAAGPIRGATPAPVGDSQTETHSDVTSAKVMVETASDLSGDLTPITRSRSRTNVSKGRVSERPASATKRRLEEAEESPYYTDETDHEGKVDRFIERCLEADTDDSCMSTESASSRPQSRTSSRGSKKPRGRGRPSTVGDYIGLKQKWAEEKLLAKEQYEEVEEMAVRLTNKMKGKRLRAEHNSQALTTEELVQTIRTSTEAVFKCAGKCGNIKGTIQGTFKEAALTIDAAVAAIAARTPEEEISRLNAANNLLKKEVEELRQEIQKLKAEKSQVTPAATQAPAPTSSVLAGDVEREIMVRVGTMMDAKLKGIEERLLPEKRLRPPLAADTSESLSSPSTTTDGPGTRAAAKRAAPAPQSAPPAKAALASQRKARTGPKTAPVQASIAEPSKVTTSPAPSPSKKSRARKKKGKSPPAPAPSQTEPRSLPPAPASMDAGWTEVVKRGKNKSSGGEKSQPNKPQPVSQKKAGPGRTTGNARRVRVPRTAAITVTMTPEAARYDPPRDFVWFIHLAKQQVDLAQLGIMDGLRFKPSQSATKLLVLSGSDVEVKADRLAAALRAVPEFTEETVRIGRPIKSEDLRLTGLDDSTGAPEVSAVISARTNCPLENISVGKISGARESRSVIVRVPAKVAKELAKCRRLLIGWASVQVTLLKPRPSRCVACWGTGHTAFKCAAGIDRSGLCFRCGEEGHKAKVCPAQVPRCLLCAAAGKAVEHMLGAKDCPQPAQKPKPAQRAGTTASLMEVDAGASAS